MRCLSEPSITHGRRWQQRAGLVLLLGGLMLAVAGSAVASLADQRSRFQQAWEAAARGDRQAFEQLGRGLEPYVLYSYYQYEDYRFRRAQVAPDEMAAFLARHDEWAFTSGLRQAWLRSLGERRRWATLSEHGAAAAGLDTENRCFLARARIAQGLTDGLLAEVQALWLAERSQPRACDPAFDWLRKRGGITAELAWRRIELAMRAGNPRLTLYLKRYVPAQEREWVERWQDLSRNRYRNLERARGWPDDPLPRKIVAVSLRRLALSDPDAAVRALDALEPHFDWPAEERGAIRRDLALQAAVALTDRALPTLASVPAAQRDTQLLEWWARAALAQSEWATLDGVVAQMPAAVQQDGRWRYWRGMALNALGDRQAALAMLGPLATEASYYGFLAADSLGRPYSICPQEPVFDTDEVARLRQRPDFGRSLELRTAGLDGWAASEWGLAVERLEPAQLRAAAALARDEGWHDRVIFALGESGDNRYYAWRFPLVWEQAVGHAAVSHQLEKAWVLGVMRSESALDSEARSTAGALGLMQVTPATARRLARQYGLPYTGQAQLREAEANIRFGTTFMRELMDRYQQNPALVAGAYNAGPQAVDRWLRTRPAASTAAWVETVPYFETRDYIPRVMAFTAIYEWRLQQPVRRVSSRMPDIDSGNMTGPETAEVVCLASG